MTVLDRVNVTTQCEIVTSCGCLCRYEFLKEISDIRLMPEHIREKVEAPICAWAWTACHTDDVEALFKITEVHNNIGTVDERWYSLSSAVCESF